MSYPVNTALTYTAVASTAGLPLDTFTYSWTFDDTTNGTGASLSHTWTTTGQHQATVSATDNFTGTVATASKTVNVVNIPSALQDGLLENKAFTVGTDVYTSFGAQGTQLYQVQKLLANGSTAHFYTGGITLTGDLAADYNGSTGSAISLDGVWIVGIPISGGSSSTKLYAFNTSTGTVQGFDFANYLGFPYAIPNKTAMIVPRADGKFAISLSNNSWGSPYTFLYDPSTNTIPSYTTFPYSYRGGMALYADDGYVYCLSKYLGGDTIYKYSVAGNTWSTATMTSSQYDAGAGRNTPSVCKMADGRFLIAGGLDNGNNNISNVAVFDPATLTITDKASMSVARYHFPMSLLPDGRVLAVGSRNSSTNVGNNTGEVYNPLTNNWSPVSNTMSVPRGGCGMTKMASGNFCITGGWDGSANPLASVEYYHPADNKFYSVD